MKWTEEAIRAEAAKYRSKMEFLLGSKCAYQAAWRRGMIDKLEMNRKRHPVKWTEEAIRAEAAKYRSKAEFRRGNSGAYQAALKQGMIDELFGTEVIRLVVPKWTKETLCAEAAKYRSKKDLEHGNSGAYQAAYVRFPGLLDELFGTEVIRLVVPKWTEEAIRAEAAKYHSKKEFDRGNNGAYGAALTRFPGLLDELFGENFRWTEESVRAEASKYSTKVDLLRGNPSAYSAAWKRGLIDELFENQPRYTDGDAIYIWRVEGVTFKKRPVFKVGITSARLGFRRIHSCASKNKVKATDIHLFKLENAEKVEAGMHKLLTVVPDCGFTDGKTEFRSCTESTIKTVIAFVSNYGERMAA